jgi:hypothetical protein
MTVLLFLMAIPVTRLALGRISEMLSTLGDFVIWSGGTTSDFNKQIILLLGGLLVITHK